MNKIPLHIAAENNSKELVELLIGKGADIHAKDYYLSYYNKIIFNKYNFKLIKKITSQE